MTPFTSGLMSLLIIGISGWLIVRALRSTQRSKGIARRISDASIDLQALMVGVAGLLVGVGLILVYVV